MHHLWQKSKLHRRKKRRVRASVGLPYKLKNPSSQKARKPTRLRVGKYPILKLTPLLSLQILDILLSSLKTAV